MKSGTLFQLILKVLFVIILVGCSTQTNISTPSSEQPLSSTTSTPEPVIIKFWEYFGGASGDFFDAEAALFHETYPWITVEVEHFPDRNAYREALTLSFESGNAPDVFLRRHSVDQMVENKWIQPLTPWITDDWLARFPANSFIETRNMWQGEIYSFLTFAKSFPYILYINEELFEKAGLVDDQGNVLVPQTWGDVRSMAKQVTDAGDGEFYGIGLSVKDSRAMSWWFDLTMLAGAPGSPGFDYHSGQYAFGTHPAYGQIIDLLLGMQEDGSVYPFEGTLDDSNIYTFFGQGKYAMFMSGSYQVANLRRDYPEFTNYQIIPLPVPDDGRTGGLATIPTSHFFMTAQSQHPDEAWLWMDWVSSRGFHERMVSNGIGFSIYPDYNNEQTIPDSHMLQAYNATTAYVVYEPFPPAVTPQTALVSPESVVPDVGDVIIGIYTGQIEDWQGALEDLDAKKQAALETAIQEAQGNGIDVSIDNYIFPDWDPMQDYSPQFGGE